MPAWRGLRAWNRLQDLNLADTGIDGPGLAHLKSLPELRYLGLSSTKIKNGLKVLKEFPRLQRLDLSFTDVGDNDLRELVPMARLEELDWAGRRRRVRDCDTLAE